jgi:peptidylprolyl isomerase
MRKILILAAMAVLAAQILPAQTQNWKDRRMRNIRPGTFNPITRPTPVSGEGVVTPSGLKYWDIQPGGGESATKGHAVKVLYRAWVEHGKEFASSITDGKPSIFTLGMGQVIPGWEEGVEGMKVGGKRQLRIPPDLAYGATAIPPLVPANATLIYDVELIALD